MASFAYLFHPSTNIHSPYTPIFTILAILLSEHLYVFIRLIVRSSLNALPSWSDITIRKGELRMKKVWLQRLLGGGNNEEKELNKRTVSTSSNSLYDVSQVISDAFKQE